MSTTAHRHWKGGKFDGKNYQFYARVPGHRDVYIGAFSEERGDEGGRKHDAVQLLVHQHKADTNFQWDSFSKADLEAAGKLLQSKKVNVRNAMDASRNQQAPKVCK
jgi:hypothetical protein